MEGAIRTSALGTYIKWADCSQKHPEGGHSACVYVISLFLLLAAELQAFRLTGLKSNPQL